MDYLWPVSYTHLDVYKRQVQIMPGPLPVRSLLAITGDRGVDQAGIKSAKIAVAPVSYTHLFPGSH